MTNIKKNFTKIIVPFCIEKPSDFAFDTATQIVKNKTLKIWEPVEFTTNYLLPIIDKKMKHHHEAIGKSFKLNHLMREAIGLPKNTTTQLQLKTRSATQKNDLLFTMNQIYVHMFETNVGFIEFEIASQTNHFDELLDINYFLSEMKVKDNIFTYEVSISKDKKEIRQSSLRAMIEHVLSDLERVYYFNDEKDFALKAIIYSYVLLDKQPENLNRMLYNGAHNFKNTYKSPDDYQQILMNFENSFWSSSSYGAINISILGNDEVTNEFLANGLYNHLKQQYFQLYLLALHQRYMVLKQMREIASLTTMKFSSIEETIQAQNMIDSFMRSHAIFKVKYLFSYVSYIEHINHYFDLIQKGFYIPQLIEELNIDLQGLASLSDAYYKQYVILKDLEQEQQNLKSQLRSATIRIYVNIISQIIGGLSVFKLVWDVSSLLIPDVLDTLPYVLISLVATIVFLCIMLTQLIEPIKERKHIKQAMILKGYIKGKNA